MKHQPHISTTTYGVRYSRDHDVYTLYPRLRQTNREDVLGSMTELCLDNPAGKIRVKWQEAAA